jgi:hypothetical protein
MGRGGGEGGGETINIGLSSTDEADTESSLMVARATLNVLQTIKIYVDFKRCYKCIFKIGLILTN